MCARAFGEYKQAGFFLSFSKFKPQRFSQKILRLHLLTKQFRPTMQRVREDFWVAILKTCYHGA